MNPLLDAYREQIAKDVAGPTPSAPPTLATDGELETLVHWLARLRLLYGVPFHYLVPSEAMLPEESIRFFHLDPNWVAALVDGAYSIARFSRVADDKDPDRLYVYKSSEEAAQTVRSRMLRGLPDPAVVDKPRISGFLLRSDIVAHHRGIEVEGFADKAGKNKLTLLRLERITPRILLALFNGELARLVLSEPPEGIFFGFNPPKNGQFEKQPRAIVEKTDPLGQPDVRVDAAHPIPVPMRDNNKKGRNVVDVAALSKEFKTMPKAASSSGLFAFQMVQGVGKAIFALGAHATSNPTAGTPVAPAHEETRK